MAAANPSVEIAIIDRSVSGYHTLANVARAQGLEVILLSGVGDGFVELAEVLEGRADIDSLHLFSHGSSGRIQLGEAYLSTDNLDQYKGVLESIRQSFSVNGDLLIYGCDVAGSDDGVAFITLLSEYVGADVAASDDLTGNALKGGDWELEIQTGSIESTIAPDSLALQSFEDVLNFTGTINFNSAPMNGASQNSDSSINGKYTTGAYTLVVDGQELSTRIFAGSYATFGGFADGSGTQETKVTVSFEDDKVFTISSLDINNFLSANTTFEFSSNLGGSVTTASLARYAQTTVNFTGLGWEGISSLYITKSGGGNISGDIDNLVLTVGGAANNAPVFVNDGPFSIAENSSNGSVVGDINANDGDGGADDANVTYSIVSGNPNLDLDGNSAFAIDANTGAITLNDTDDIDYEVATSHTLTISATDQNSATTNQSVTINVTDDEGDNPPMLNPGDMAVLGWNALNDTITFSTLVDLPAGTVIKFTDKGWDQSTDAFTTLSTADGVITWTVGSPLTAGSVFELVMGGSDETTTLTNKTANEDLTANIVSSSFTMTDPMGIAGDSVFIYQGDDSNPLFIFGMNNSSGPVDGTNWNTSIGATLRDSMLPDSNGSQNTLTNGTNAIGLPGGASQLDNVQYTGPTSITDKTTWLARIANVGNWSGDDTGTVSTSAGSNVQIGGANAAPVFTTSSKASVAENSTAVTTLVATDADGDKVMYSITGGDDQALFSLDSKSGALTFKSAPNFEASADSNQDNIYDVDVTASDGQGGTTPLTMIVTVTDVNEAPTLTTNAKRDVLENTTGIVYTAKASDPENDQLSYTLSGTDASLFNLDTNTGALSFKSAPDYEAPASESGNNIYNVTLTANDGSLNSGPLLLSIRVTDDTNENKAPVFTSSSSFSVAENDTQVGALVATDTDGGTLTYSITGGADAGLFSLNANSGALTFINAPDFEAPADNGVDNAYDVQVTANDGQGGTTPLTLTVTVTDVNEAPTLNGKLKAPVFENTTDTVYTATASDPENDTLFYTLSGTDAALFNLDANTGALSFKSAPDYEAPDDAGGNNIYNVTLTANDGSLDSAPQALSVQVMDVSSENVAPVFTSSSSFSVAENGTKVGSLVATDTDGGTLTYSITGGADAGLFSLDANSGALTFINAPDFEAPADNGVDNAYDVQVTANDGQGGTTPLTLTVTVTDVNEAPTLNGKLKAVVFENTTDTVYTVTASDPENDTLFYTLSGTDAALFNLDANTGALSFKSAPDYEAPDDAGGDNIYNVTLTANDGSLDSAPQAGSIQVMNVSSENEAPVFTSSSKASVAENTTAVTTLVATDADDDTLTYNIIGGADQALFSLDANSGALSFITAPNFEAPNDQGQDNQYEVVVEANDGAESVAQSVTVTVTDVNEPVPPRPDPETIQVDPTPGEPLPDTPSGQPSVSETINNNGSTSGSVRLVENTGNSNVVTATLPGRVTLVHEGSRTATDRGLALEDLIASIDGKTPANLSDQTNVASQWLSSRPDGTLLDIRTLTFSSTATFSNPILLTGTDSGNGAVSNQEAFVIDVSGLPQGNQIQLDNIDFASIVGSTTIRGGAGNNVVIGDDAAQTIVLGEGDDELHGGGGNDVIGSEGGDDRLFGGSGDDELFGGEGADLLHGGSDIDVASYEGNRDDYIVTQQFSVITIQSKDDASDIDTLINFETLTFADDESALSYDEDLQWITGLYAQVLGRQADVEGVQYWAQQSANGTSRTDIALSMLNSEESGRVVQEGEAYLDLLYAGLLGREADESGKAYWSDQIAAGATLSEVVDGFMFSDEIRSHDLEAVEWDFLV